MDKPNAHAQRPKVAALLEVACSIGVGMIGIPEYTFIEMSRSNQPEVTTCAWSIVDSMFNAPIGAGI